MELRRFLGIGGLGVTWALAWGVIFAGLMLIIGGEPPNGADLSAGAAMAIQLAVTLGFLSGALFGVLLAWMENRKHPRDLSMIRAVFLGALGSAILPLATPLEDTMLATTIPVGMLCAAVSVGLARATTRGENLPPPLDWLGRVQTRILITTTSGPDLSTSAFDA
jgi:hypothetical protein